MSELSLSNQVFLDSKVNNVQAAKANSQVRGGPKLPLYDLLREKSQNGKNKDYSKIRTQRKKEEERQNFIKDAPKNAEEKKRLNPSQTRLHPEGFLV